MGAERPVGWAKVLAVSVASVCAISVAAVWVRQAEAPSSVTAFWRLTLSALLLLAVRPRQSVVLERQAWPWAVVSGVMLAVHFGTWMASLEHTSLLSSTLLVTTTPVWLALVARWIPDEPRLGARGMAGLGVAVAGGAGLLWGSRGAVGVEEVTAWGSLLAWLGAVSAGAYWWAGRVGRRSAGVESLSFWSTLVAALALWLWILVQGERWLTGYDSSTWSRWLLLAAVPQLVGHNGLLWLLRHWSATAVSVLVLLEPVVATLFGQWAGLASPSPSSWLWSLLTVAGVLLVVCRAAGDVSRETAS
jgi:drug/metabolite transporter (DMT)-like permease